MVKAPMVFILEKYNSILFKDLYSMLVYLKMNMQINKQNKYSKTFKTILNCKNKCDLNYDP